MANNSLDPDFEQEDPYFLFFRFGVNERSFTLESDDQNYHNPSWRSTQRRLSCLPRCLAFKISRFPFCVEIQHSMSWLILRLRSWILGISTIDLNNYDHHQFARDSERSILCPLSGSSKNLVSMMIPGSFVAGWRLRSGLTVEVHTIPPNGWVLTEKQWPN